MRGLWSIVVVAVALGAAAPARAEEAPPPPPAPPPPNSSVEQYIETIPTGSGSAAVGHTNPPKPVAPEARKRLHDDLAKAGSDAPILEDIVTSSTYGAPEYGKANLRPKKTRAGAARPTKARAGATAPKNAATGTERHARSLFEKEVDRSNPLNPEARRVGAGDAVSAAVTSVADVDAGRLVLLLAGLAVISVLTLAAATRRRRDPRFPA